MRCGPIKSPRVEISMSSSGGISMKKLIGVLNCAFLLCLLMGCGGGVGRPLSQPVTIISLVTELEITSPQLPNGPPGADYGGAGGYSLTASGGIAPYTWGWVANAGS